MIIYAVITSSSAWDRAYNDDTTTILEWLFRNCRNIQNMKFVQILISLMIIAMMTVSLEAKNTHVLRKTAIKNKLKAKW